MFSVKSFCIGFFLTRYSNTLPFFYLIPFNHVLASHSCQGSGGDVSHLLVPHACDGSDSPDLGHHAESRGLAHGDGYVCQFLLPRRALLGRTASLLGALAAVVSVRVYRVAHDAGHACRVGVSDMGSAVLGDGKHTSAARRVIIAFYSAF